MRWSEKPEKLVRFQSVTQKIRIWCNGSIRVSKTFDLSSNLSIRAIKLWCSSEAEQGAVNSKVGDFKIPHHSDVGFYIFKLTR